MPKYENSIIYKIKHNEDYDDTNIYVGSTTNFKNRKNQHKTVCNNEKDKHYNLFVYQFIRENGGWDNWVMIPIEQFSCNDKKELLIRERHHVDLLRPTLNQVIPTRTVKEWYQDNKEKVLEKAKDYYESNKEKILEQKKEYHESNKEKIAEYNKQYNEDNKEKILEKKKIYYQDNKEKILEKQKEKIFKNVICDHCGCQIREHNLKKHQKSKKCINFVKS